jgi:hypothetical protein
MEIISEDIQVEENDKDKTVTVTYTRVDKLQPEEFVQNYDQLSQYITQAKNQLGGLDAEKEKLKENLSKQIELHEKKLKGLDPALSTAKAWKAVTAKFNEERKPKQQEVKKA